MGKVLKVNNYIPKKVKLIRVMFHVCLIHCKISMKLLFYILRSTLGFGALSGKMLLVRIVENN